MEIVTQSNEKISLLFGTLKKEREKGIISDLEINRLKSLSNTGLVPLYGWESTFHNQRIFFDEWIDGKEISKLINSSEFDQEKIEDVTRLWLRIAKAMLKIENKLIYPEDRNEDNVIFPFIDKRNRSSTKKYNFPICVDIGEKFEEVNIISYFEYLTFGYNSSEIDHFRLLCIFVNELYGILPLNNIIDLLNAKNDINNTFLKNNPTFRDNINKLKENLIFIENLRNGNSLGSIDINKIKFIINYHKVIGLDNYILDLYDDLSKLNHSKNYTIVKQLRTIIKNFKNKNSAIHKSS